jgi:hypothetical protein
VAPGTVGSGHGPLVRPLLSAVGVAFPAVVVPAAVVSVAVGVASGVAVAVAV